MNRAQVPSSLRTVICCLPSPVVSPIATLVGRAGRPRGSAGVKPNTPSPCQMSRTDPSSVLAHAIAESSAFSIAGGGDTLAAVEQFGVADKLSYISTGGGAFLEFLEGKKLPAVAILEERGARS